jgi:HPt (histidine-containing phosphotransfer) domain-containing protein
MGKFNIEIDESLMDIMPSFIELTEKDMQDLEEAVQSKDYEKIKKLAHTLKGDSGGYGFDEMSKLSKQLELYALDKKDTAVDEQFATLSEYWAEVKENFQALQ